MISEHSTVETVDHDNYVLSSALDMFYSFFMIKILVTDLNQFGTLLCTWILPFLCASHDRDTVQRQPWWL